MKAMNSIVLYFIRNWMKKETSNRFLFNHHFFNNRYYLQKSASDEYMAFILNITVSELNIIVKQSYDHDFKTLCDLYRFKHFWEEFTNPLNANLPVQSIISSCGFNSVDDFKDSMKEHKEESKIILKKQFS